MNCMFCCTLTLICTVGRLVFILIYVMTLDLHILNWEDALISHLVAKCSVSFLRMLYDLQRYC
jgi:hypothetical protein